MFFKEKWGEKKKDIFLRLREFQHISMAEAKQTKFYEPAW